MKRKYEYFRCWNFKIKECPICEKFCYLLHTMDILSNTQYSEYCTRVVFRTWQYLGVPGTWCWSTRYSYQLLYLVLYSTVLVGVLCCRYQVPGTVLYWYSTVRGTRYCTVRCCSVPGIPSTRYCTSTLSTWGYQQVPGAVYLVLRVPATVLYCTVLVGGGAECIK